jgi:multidrug efflux system membrane fusion protein
MRDMLEQEEVPSDILRHTPPRRLKLMGVVALAGALITVALGVIDRVEANQRLKDWTSARAVPVVHVISLASDADAGALVLPGAIQAFYDAPIHARVSGYLKQWYADIGTPVRAGQILAEIDTPDLDQQLAQAKADLGTAVANQHLSETTAHRWAGLLTQDAVSRQDADNKNGDLEAKTALVAAAQANVHRLEALESFKHITAPFDGIVTTRSTDIGALISVGGATDTPLFTVSDEKRLRIYVQVPQSFSADIKPGMTTTFTVPEYPGRLFTAQLAATADAITPQTGAQTIQLQIDNTDAALKPGDYAQVHFTLPADHGVIRAPASALMFRDAGMSVAVIGPDGRVAIKTITIGRDLGSTVEVTAGLSPADRIIDNPPDSLRPGDSVRIAANDLAPDGAQAHALR